MKVKMVVTTCHIEVCGECPALTRVWNCGEVDPKRAVDPNAEPPEWCPLDEVES